MIARVAVCGDVAVELCHFPERLCPNTIIVTTDDYCTLEEGEYINDIIIDFYLTYIHHEVLNKEHRDNVHIFRCGGVSSGVRWLVGSRAKLT